MRRSPDFLPAVFRYPVWVLVLSFLAGCAPQHFSRKGPGGISLYLEAPDAQEVLFASSTDNFQPHQTTRTENGLWFITNLNNREFMYFYLVDGRPYTPDCRYQQRDDFGTYTCIYQP